MSQKLERKLRQGIAREGSSIFNRYLEAINAQPLKIRFLWAYKCLLGKLPTI